MHSILKAIEAQGIKIILLRHGPSLANLNKLIVSSLRTDQLIEAGLDPQFIPKLTEQLKVQAGSHALDRQTLIFTSPLKRTRETAQLLKNILNTTEPVISASLIERSFGDFDGGSDENYQKVWNLDLKSDSAESFKVETVAQVQARLISFLSSLDLNKLRGSKIVLVSHGDPINIILAYAKGDDSVNHRSFNNKQIATGEMTELSCR